MGLDNGIILRHRNKEKIEKILPNYVNIGIDDYYTDTNQKSKNDTLWDVCYWRKCWGLRDRILEVLKNKGSDDFEQYEFELMPDNLRAIRDILIDYLTRPFLWDNENRSIWDFKNMIDHLAQDVVNISWLINVLECDHKASAFFYDSY